MALSVPACVGDTPGDDGQSEAARSRSVWFAEPTNGATLSGDVKVQLETNILDAFTSVQVTLDGVPLVALGSLPSAFVVSTLQFDDGEHLFELSATTPSNERYSDAVTVNIDNPEHRLVVAQPRRSGYGRGEQMVLDLEYSAEGLEIDADFSMFDSEFDRNRLSVEELGAGKYQVRYTVSEENSKDSLRYQLAIDSIGADDIILSSQVSVGFLGYPRLPLVASAPGAVFTELPPPIQEVGAGAPRIDSVSVPRNLVQGAPQILSVAWSAPAENPADRLVLHSPTASGAWVIPLPEPSTGGTMDVLIDAIGASETIAGHALDLQLAALAADGAAAPQPVSAINILTMGVVGVRVVLNWAGASDLDLSVTTPDGSKIDYVHRQAQGGSLDVDSNSSCTLSLSPTESVFWPAGSEVPGEYGVQVSRWDNCGQTSQAYTVTILACGESETVNGVFDSEEPSPSTHSLPGFVVDCLQRVHGKVEFMDSDRYDAVKVPAISVPVIVNGTGAGRPPATTTDMNGNYDLYFPVVAGADAVVEVLASFTPAGANEPRARVIERSGDQVHKATLHLGDITLQRGPANITIDTRGAAGAFNILDAMRRAFAWVDANLSAESRARVASLAARWNRTMRSGGAKSYYDADRQGIWVSDLDTDPDSFDDSVIAHEFMHHVVALLRADSAIGAEHDLYERAEPATAWSEGLATALGQQALRDRHYLDYSISRDGAFVGVVDFDLETTTHSDLGGATFRTSPALSMVGKVGEALVAAVLWDLMDPPGETQAFGSDAAGGVAAASTSAAMVVDDVDMALGSTYSTLQRYLSSSDWVDRGRRARDLVDFLDGWTCYRRRNLALSGFGPDAANQNRDVVLAYREFFYEDPSIPTVCP